MKRAKIALIVIIPIVVCALLAVGVYEFVRYKESNGNWFLVASDNSTPASIQEQITTSEDYLTLNNKLFPLTTSSNVMRNLPAIKETCVNLAVADGYISYCNSRWAVTDRDSIVKEQLHGSNAVVGAISALSSSQHKKVKEFIEQKSVTVTGTVSFYK